MTFGYAVTKSLCTKISSTKAMIFNIVISEIKCVRGLAETMCIVSEVIRYSCFSPPNTKYAINLFGQKTQIYPKNKQPNKKIVYSSEEHDLYNLTTKNHCLIVFNMIQ